MGRLLGGLVSGLGCRVWGLGFKVSGSKSRIRWCWWWQWWWWCKGCSRRCAGSDAVAMLLVVASVTVAAVM